MSNDAKPGADDDTWAHIRMRYEQAVETVAQIAASIGLTSYDLTKRAKTEGWTLRSKAKTAKPQTTRETIKRLKELLQRRLTQLESQLAELGQEVDALASDRDIRATNTLVRTLEKVLELESKDRKQRSQRARESKKLNDTERDELARRIANLLPEQDRQASPETDDAPADQGDIAGLATVGAPRSTSA